MTIEKSYRVAGFTFRVKADDALLERMSNLQPFETASRQKDLFSLEQVDNLPKATHTPLYHSNDGPAFVDISLWEVEQGYLFEMRPLPSLPVAACLLIDKSFSHSCLALCGTDDVFGLNNALMLHFAFASARHGALEMHSSVVMNQGKGYLFLGRSGTGKSTHSRMWLENIPGTELLNDDNPILRLLPGGEVRVYGSPWSGKTPCYKAQDVPVGAIVRIIQAPANEIVRLDRIQAYASLMGSASAFRPFPELADGWHQTLEAMVQSVPSYNLSCLPDAAAAELCYQTVHG